jgi:anthranilate phosphoribosyltransferase
MVVNGKDEAVAMLKAALGDIHAGASAMVALNAGAAIYVSGKTGSLQEGVSMARSAISSGAAQARLNDYIHFSQS